MASKTINEQLRVSLAKSYYRYLKDTATGDSFYAAVSYIDSDSYFNYTGTSVHDSDAETFGGRTQNDYDDYDKMYILQNTYSMHKIYTGGISRVIPRHDWAYQTIYNSYPSNDCHVMVKEYVAGVARLSVYRCLFSPRKESVYSPSGISTSEIYLPDGYVWKYMYTISNSEAIRFITSDWLPIPEKIDDAEATQITSSSTRYNVYAVQNSAVPGELYGFEYDSDAFVASHSLAVGSTLTLKAVDMSTNNPTTDCLIDVSIDTSLNRIVFSLIKKGEGYAGPIKFVNSADGVTEISGFRALVAPEGGHGSNIPLESGASDVMLVARVLPSDGVASIINENPFNIVSLIKNPIDRATGKVSQQDYYFTCRSVDVENNNPFVVGDIIKSYPGVDSRRGIVIATDGLRVFYMNYEYGKDYDVFTAEDSISNLTDTKTASISTANEREVSFNTGDLLSVDKKNVILRRSKDQIESYNFVLSF